jgi:hypothetical protein
MLEKPGARVYLPLLSLGGFLYLQAEACYRKKTSTYGGP